MQIDDLNNPVPTPEPEDELRVPQPSRVQLAVQLVKDELGKAVIGQEVLQDLLLAALFTNGHVLVEGVPGIAKTLTAKLLAQTLEVGFSRIQFTPDLMPSDVLGTTVFNVKESVFSFKAGPIFSNVVLIDEINRAPAKTQAALFEVMEEHQVTIDGQSHRMSEPFFVIATQNPIEQEGTYQLPEAQLDRFLFKIQLEYPSLEEERAILHRFRKDFAQTVTESVRPVLSAEDVKACRRLIEEVEIEDSLLEYIAQIVVQTRTDKDLFLGASPRASLALLKASKAIAAMRGRQFVMPEDIQYVAFPVLNHRIILTADRELEGYDPKLVVEEMIRNIEVPR